ncbi:MAG: LytR family transcriptional regulator, partial [Oscillospiraceae bacterium]|nr:LytR family transcriptional regulator [Oscillospiraceae bacterium]
SLYSTLSKYMVTDISVDEVGYLATQVLGYSFSGDRMYVLEGETRIGEIYEEFYVDEDALYRLVLDVFYEEVG